MRIELTSDEYAASLLLALGYATGAALKDGDKRMANSFTRVTNAVCRNDPNFRPYKVQDDKQ